jgi:hypothetical protein
MIRLQVAEAVEMFSVDAHASTLKAANNGVAGAKRRGCDGKHFSVLDALNVDGRSPRRHFVHVVGTLPALSPRVKQTNREIFGRGIHLFSTFLISEQH